MELAEALRRRRMVRRYDPTRPVDPEVVDALLDAARRSPTAGFTQGVSILSLTTEPDRTTFWSATAGPESTTNTWLDGIRTAPLLILIWTSELAYRERYAEPDKGWPVEADDRWSAPYWYVDAGMAAMAILLRSVDAGLGACFFGVPPDRQDAVRSAFGVPPDQASVGVVSVGYPAPGGAAGSPGRRRRRSRGVVHHGRWRTDA